MRKGVPYFEITGYRLQRTKVMITETLAWVNNISSESFSLYYSSFNFSKIESLVALTDFCVLESQAIRMIKYDRAGNLNSAVSSPLTLNDAKLVFYRLDAGVIVGKEQHQSQRWCYYVCLALALHWHDWYQRGRIRIDQISLPKDVKGIKLKYRGDGKTSKVIHGAGGPFSKIPSWQADLSTTKDETN
jgi:hypothetical protein